MPPIAFPFDYTAIEASIASRLHEWESLSFDAIVAIARGGLIPATLIASELSLPLLALSYRRDTREVRWLTHEQPSAGQRLLLVEDIAGRGHTLADCLDFLQQRKMDVKTFVLAFDGESRVAPDYGRHIPDGARAWFPWERETITDTFAATGNLPSQPQRAYAAWAIDLDGILLPDIPEHAYAQDLEATLALRDTLAPAGALPPLPGLRSLPIITGRPESDRGRTVEWLERHGFQGPLFMRDPSRHTTAQTALHKADVLLRNRYTHFLESDAAQALVIARASGIAAVFWWDGTQAMRVHASLAPLDCQRKNKSAACAAPDSTADGKGSRHAESTTLED
ncbi:phosphoribosyltransferase family protein [Paracandidimonas soli]|uniref:Phosphoribosyl transferase-like protein n=1 Tax=Paracandidimonas soli TaxID=1917182 RepID=A0A4R3V6H2_9BURK|nr:phosphoribosyltransferase family protein [Paracandidimonas soli]TCU99171.1 phosphoribosyl transferase-like protein [Paracandidimonas soli]